MERILGLKILALFLQNNSKEGDFARRVFEKEA